MLNYKNTKVAEKTLDFEQIREYYKNSCKEELKFGLEYERISINSTTLKNADYNCIEKIIKNFAHIKGWGLLYDEETLIGAIGENSSVSLEPGCQFELSLEPKKEISEIEKSAKEICSLLNRVAKFYNVEFLPIGITPCSTYQNINIVEKQRYKIMAEHLPKYGKFAPVMMRETAGVQLNIDYKSENDAIKKIKLLSYISPFLTGFFANSPIRNNKLSNYKSYRALAWKYTGKERCSLFYKNIIDADNATFDDYINAILDVPMLFIERNGQKVVIGCKITFREFMQNGYMEYGATIKDYILHASLCFPDVRLKNCIEIRNHDSQSLDMTLAMCAFYKGILQSDFEEIFEYFSEINSDDLDKMGFLAAKCGIDFNYKNFDAKIFIKKLFEIANKNLKDEEKLYLKKAFKILDSGKCIADLAIESNVKNAQDLKNYLKRVNNC